MLLLDCPYDFRTMGTVDRMAAAGGSGGFLAAYSLQVLAPGHPLAGPAEVVIVLVWVFFAIDYIARLVLTPARGRWFIRHLHDLAMVVLPALRPLRLLRLITVFNVLQSAAGTALRGRVVTYVTGSSLLLVYVASLAMLDAERDVPDATITTFGDALWWAFVTITTVGYGDYAPVTTMGRAIAVGLMIGGIALVGIVTATLASWLVEKVSEGEQRSVQDTAQALESLRQEVAALREATVGMDRQEPPGTK